MILRTGMGQQRSITREMPRLSLRAGFEPSTINVEARTVDVTWTTGARVLRGFYEPYYEELSLDPKHVRMERLTSGNAPLLDTHRSDSIDDIIGIVESARLEKGKGTATVRFDSGAKGEDAFRRVREGTLRNLSVGYNTFKMLKVEDGATTTPVYRAVDWEPHELTLAPIGADAGAVTRSAGGMTPCEFIQERDMPDPVPTATPTPTPATEPAPTLAPANGDQTRAAATAERERVLGIQRVGRALSRPAPEVDAAVTSGTSLDAFRAAAVDALADAPPADGGVIPFDKRDPRIQAGADSRDKYLRSAENWILHRAGVAKLVADGAAKRGEKMDLDPGECRGMTLVEMARDSLERSGVRTRGMDVMVMVGQALTRIGPGLQSTSDFSFILETAMNKTLLGAYATVADTWRRFAKKGTVSDFRAHTRYRQGSFGVLETVIEGGEYKNAPIPDGSKESISAATKGRIVGITRQAIINDDMGAFNDFATRLGRAAARTIEVDVYNLLAQNGGLGPIMGDGFTLFHANHGNIGAGAALSVASIDADRVLMGSQKEPNNNDIADLRPEILLVPLGLGGQARVINQAQYDVDAKVNARTQEPNRVVGLYKDIIDTARLAGTRRYSIADPSIAAVIEVVFLNGNETPYLETKEGWRIDGVEWKVRLDSGVGAIDWRGAVTNAGV